MTTEIIGYIGQQQTVQKPTETHTEPRKIKSIHINAIKSKLLGALLIVLGAMTIQMENDATAFVMCFFLGLAAMIGGNDDE